MALQLGDTAPDFTAVTTHGEVSFHEWLGDQWAVFFSHPADFTPICTTELGRVATLKEHFDKRNAKVIAISADSVEDHKGWIGDIEETQSVAMNYPIIADPERKVAELYGMIHPKADPKLTVRSVFFIDPQKKVRATVTYPPAIGRNFDEILRVLDALQLTDRHEVATPVDWRPGEDVVIKPSVSDDRAKELFPDGFKTLKPYLRVTRQPQD